MTKNRTRLQEINAQIAHLSDFLVELDKERIETYNFIKTLEQERTGIIAKVCTSDKAGVSLHER